MLKLTQHIKHHTFEYYGQTHSELCRALRQGISRYARHEDLNVDPITDILLEYTHNEAALIRDMALPHPWTRAQFNAEFITLLDFLFKESNIATLETSSFELSLLVQ